MKNSREIILNTLMTQHQATIAELARIAGINGISVRHHLINMQEEGLVGSFDERHGVGRPRSVFFLTDKGLEHFPTNFLRLTRQLLVSIREFIPEETRQKFYEHLGAGMAKDRNLDSTLPMFFRIQLLVQSLTSDGYSLQTEEENGRFALINSMCPYKSIGSEYPEICKIDKAYIDSMLGQKSEIKSCILCGDADCRFAFPAES